MDPIRITDTRRALGFPRRRGDGPHRPRRLRPWRTFPPQARGWTCRLVRCKGGVEVSPAGAGMDLQWPLASGYSGGFPRRRGDGPCRPEPWRQWRPFPPQARGWTLRFWQLTDFNAVSPAGAGMDPRGPVQQGLLTRFPRRRGDGPILCLAADLLAEFPPQARSSASQPTSSQSFPRRRGDGPQTSPTRDHVVNGHRKCQGFGH